MDSSAFYFNQHPIAHANHFEFSTKYLEIASASGYKNFSSDKTKITVRSLAEIIVLNSIFL